VLSNAIDLTRIISATYPMRQLPEVRPLQPASQINHAPPQSPTKEETAINQPSVIVTISKQAIAMHQQEMAQVAQMKSSNQIQDYPKLHYAANEKVYEYIKMARCQ
jgi:hypothetical protein